MPDHVIKRCTKCGDIKPVNQFGRDSKALDGLFYWCKACVRAQDRKRYEANQGRERARTQRYRQLNLEAILRREAERKTALRKRIFGHYGTACACCGTTEDLTIDHVDTDGKQHRQDLFGAQRGGTGFYRWLVKHDLPEGYQTLCRRCNLSKARGAHCRLDHAIP